ncbi:ada2a-containing complex component 2 isoform X2 [Calliopsis andreniformis]|uniref:ada2a-containing complex component 2 isoform X2 n=1 Tax=Calliopsis andreniformis TaxID=337506 RepID=UPI003FCD1BF2
MSEAANEGMKADTIDFSDAEVCKKCGHLCNPYNKPALRCNGCSKKIHIECLKRGSVPVSFVGDVFFELHCCHCSPFVVSVKEDIFIGSLISVPLWTVTGTIYLKKLKRKKNWIGTISGTLSHYSGIFFKSGTTELGESGWWRLIDNDPPEVLIAKNEKMIMDRKKQIGNQTTKPTNRLPESSAQVEPCVPIKEDSTYENELTKNEEYFSHSQADMQPDKTLLDFLLEEDELNNMEIEDDTILSEQHDTPSLCDLIRDCQYQTNNFHFSQLLDDFASDWASNTDTTSETLNNIKMEHVKEEEEEEEEEEEQDEEESSDSMSSVQEQPPTSLFTVTRHRPWPWQRNCVIEEKIPRMTHQEEAYLLQQVNKPSLNLAPPKIRRFYRKLAVRKLKREYGLPILDIDNFGFKTEMPDKPSKDSDRVLDRFFGDDLGSYEQRLQGYNEPTAVHSPYTNRLLKPFIRRDTSCRPLWLRVMEELRVKVNKHNPKWKSPPTASIDYSYVRPQHIPAINSLCSQFFWPGIDLTECLQYPDFSCVVLYKKLVIGFAILVPDVGYNEAYISFFLTRPEWRRSGIGTFMLYHLIQTCMGKDVTLHVSATNPALILYQKFGFKVEEFVQDFYDKYMPPSSRECRHALFLRLSR